MIFSPAQIYLLFSNDNDKVINQNHKKIIFHILNNNTFYNLRFYSCVNLSLKFILTTVNNFLSGLDKKNNLIIYSVF